jgi:hypothetical protein
VCDEQEDPERWIHDTHPFERTPDR